MSPARSPASLRLLNAAAGEMDGKSTSNNQEQGFLGKVFLCALEVRFKSLMQAHASGDCWREKGDGVDASNISGVKKRR